MWFAARKTELHLHSRDPQRDYTLFSPEAFPRANKFIHFDLVAFLGRVTG